MIRRCRCSRQRGDARSGRAASGILLGKRQRAGEQANVDVGPDTIGQELFDSADLADAGQEDQHVARLLFECPQYGVAVACSTRAPFIIGSHRTSTPNERPTLSMVGASPSTAAQLGNIRE